MGIDINEDGVGQEEEEEKRRLKKRGYARRPIHHVRSVPTKPDSHFFETRASPVVVAGWTVSAGVRQSWCVSGVTGKGEGEGYTRLAEFDV